MSPDVDAGSPLVSAVVVVTFDRPHLPTLWEDLAAQTYRPFEVVVVDNASSDGSAEFVASHPLPVPVRVVSRTTNAGVSPAWNDALREARGQWLLLLSPDCRFPPDLTRRLVARVTAAEGAGPPLARVGGASPSFRWQGRPGSPIELSPHILPRPRASGSAVPDRDEVFSYHGACALVSAELLHRLGGWDNLVNFGGDEVDVGLRAHLLGYRFYIVPDLVAEHPYDPRGGGKPGPLRRMRLRSTWFSLLKHAGITIEYGALGHESVHHLFWNRLIANPRELGAMAAWFVAVAPTLAERRRELRSLYDSARPDPMR